MTQAPEDSNQGGVANAALAADDGGDGDYVVRVGGVPHAEEKTESDDREESDHFAGKNIGLARASSADAEPPQQPTTSIYIRATDKFKLQVLPGHKRGAEERALFV